MLKTAVEFSMPNAFESTPVIHTLAMLYQILFALITRAQENAFVTTTTNLIRITAEPTKNLQKQLSTITQI